MTKTEPFLRPNDQEYIRKLEVALLDYVSRFGISEKTLEAIQQGDNPLLASRLRANTYYPPAEATNLLS